MALQSGDVLYIYCVYAKPRPKNKYVICVCPQTSLFLFINTKPRRIAQDAQVGLLKNELQCLKNDSFIDTSKLVTFSKREIDKAEPKGFLIDPIRQRIRYAVTNHNYLPPRHKQLILENLTSSKTTQEK